MEFDEKINITYISVCSEEKLAHIPMLQNLVTVCDTKSQRKKNCHWEKYEICNENVLKGLSFRRSSIVHVAEVISLLRIQK